MKRSEQQYACEVRDYTKDYKIEPTGCGKHADIFPKNIFCVIAGATGSGKTNLLVSFLKEQGRLNYSDVYVYTPTLY